MLSNISSDYSTDKKSNNHAFLKLDDADHFIQIPAFLISKNRRAYLHIGTTHIYNLVIDNKNDITLSYEQIAVNDTIMPFAQKCAQIYC